MFIAGLLVIVGCSSATPSKSAAPKRKGYGMGGVAQKIIVSRAALENRPKPWVLSTPESAVHSYIGWVSYAYRTSQSEVASPTMTPSQFVRVDAYNQMNLQKEQLLDQTLQSITLGKPSVKGARALVPAREKWTYRYVSINSVGKTLRGPFSASYETTYTLAKTKNGWVVDNIAVKPVGTIK